MTVFEKEYVKISYIEEKELVEIIWNEKSEMISDEEFKDVNLQYVSIVEKNKTKRSLINSQKFHFTIQPELQLWVADKIIPKLVKKGLNSVAFLVSKEFISQLSIEQTMDEGEEKTQALEIEYFDDKTKAMAWLMA